MTVEDKQRNDRLWQLVAIEDMTLSDAGREVGLSHERVRQIIYRTARRLGMDFSFSGGGATPDERSRQEQARIKWQAASQKYGEDKLKQIDSDYLKSLTGQRGAEKLTEVRATLSDADVRTAKDKYIAISAKIDRAISARSHKLKKIRQFAKRRPMLLGDPL